MCYNVYIRVTLHVVTFLKKSLLGIMTTPKNLVNYKNKTFRGITWLLVTANIIIFKSLENEAMVYSKL